MDIDDNNAAANEAAAGDVHPGNPARFSKLPDLWTNSPAAQLDMFSLVTAVLPEPSARRIAHLLATPGDDCYNILKAVLLGNHQLTAFQKAE